MNATVISVRKPRYIDNSNEGGGSGKAKLASCVVATIDLESDGRRIHRACLSDADEAGLILEFNVGTSTTKLDAAIGAHLDALTDAEAGEFLTAAQKGFVGTQKTWDGSGGI